MTTKFNQGMYSRMRAKKNESLSNLGTKGVRVMEKGIPVTIATPSTPAVKSARTASPATSIEEIPPQQSKGRGPGISKRRKLTPSLLTFGMMLRWHKLGHKTFLPPMI